MPLPNIFEFIGTNVTQAGFKAAQEKLLQYLGGEVPTKEELNNAVSSKVEKSYVDTAFSAYVGGRKAYTTLALAQAEQSSLPANTAIEITDDGANNGTYQWDGTTLTKSAYDPLTQAKSYTNAELQNKVLNFFSPHFDLNDIFNLLDINENSALRVAQNGDLFIYGRSDAVQKIIRDLEKKISPLFSVDGLSDLYTLPDKNDIPVVRIDQRGEIFIIGFAESLQTILAKVQDTKNADEPKAVTVLVVF